ncbi:MAG: hypothetical protein QM528_06570 [Phycisphaerales bacterium]|nr:hypothetical protein [Phycisphaerales bacterium]
MKKKSLNLGYSLTRDAIKKINGGVYVLINGKKLEVRVGCSRDECAQSCCCNINDPWHCCSNCSIKN